MHRGIRFHLGPVAVIFIVSCENRGETSKSVYRNWIVITTINPPGNTARVISKLCESDWSGIVVGDTKTPPDWSAPNITFLSIDDQRDLFGELAALIPSRHYSRKNLGYAYAIANGANVILETDDDNIPYATFGKVLDRMVEGQIAHAHGWFNVYKYFTDAFIWPRGLPLENVRSAPVLEEETRMYNCPIQQYLADEDPDVDAIYRLLHKDPVFFKQRCPVIAGENSWVPFNSQNTIFFSEAFPLFVLAVPRKHENDRHLAIVPCTGSTMESRRKCGVLKCDCKAS